MAWFECEHGTRYPIFGEGGGVREAERLKVPLLGQIPIDVQTRECADNGTPIALLSETDSTVSAAFKETAAKVVARVHR